MARAELPKSRTTATVSNAPRVTASINSSNEKPRRPRGGRQAPARRVEPGALPVCRQTARVRPPGPDGAGSGFGSDLRARRVSFGLDGSGEGHLSCQYAPRPALSGSRPLCRRRLAGLGNDGHEPARPAARSPVAPVPRRCRYPRVSQALPVPASAAPVTGTASCVEGVLVAGAGGPAVPRAGARRSLVPLSWPWLGGFHGLPPKATCPAPGPCQETVTVAKPPASRAMAPSPHRQSALARKRWQNANPSDRRARRFFVPLAERAFPNADVECRQLGRRTIRRQAIRESATSNATSTSTRDVPKACRLAHCRERGWSWPPTSLVLVVEVAVVVAIPTARSGGVRFQDAGVGQAADAGRRRGAQHETRRVGRQKGDACLADTVRMFAETSPVEASPSPSASVSNASA